MTDLLKIVKNDARTCTGSNLRRIMLLAGKTSILSLHGADFQYHKIPECEACRIDFLKGLIDVKQELKAWSKLRLKKFLNIYVLSSKLEYWTPLPLAVFHPAQYSSSTVLKKLCYKPSF